jgi:predicted DNA-binding protein
MDKRDAPDTSRRTRQLRSFRLPPDVLERLDRRARELGLTQTALVERYVEEGLRLEDHPGIYFMDEPAGRRAKVGGTGLNVWEVILVVQDNDGSTAAAADYLAVPERFVTAATRYYADFPAEIDEWIRENDRLYEIEEARWRRVADALG